MCPPPLTWTQASCKSLLCGHTPLCALLSNLAAAIHSHTVQPNLSPCRCSNPRFIYSPGPTLRAFCGSRCDRMASPSQHQGVTVKCSWISRAYSREEAADLHVDGAEAEEWTATVPGLDGWSKSSLWLDSLSLYFFSQAF